MIGAVLLVGGAVSLCGPADAFAVVPPKRCGTITVGDRDYRVRAHIVPCKFARRQSRRFLKTGEHNAGWSCTRYPAKVTRIAFNCRKGSKDYYAIRK